MQATAGPTAEDKLAAFAQAHPPQELLQAAEEKQPQLTGDEVHACLARMRGKAPGPD